MRLRYSPCVWMKARRRGPAPRDAGASLPAVPCGCWTAELLRSPGRRPGEVEAESANIFAFCFWLFAFFRKYLTTLTGPLLSQALIPPHTHAMNEIGDIYAVDVLEFGAGVLIPEVPGGEGRRGHVPASPLLRGVCHLSGLQQGPSGKGTVLESRIQIPPLVLYY